MPASASLVARLAVAGGGLAGIAALAGCAATAQPADAGSPSSAGRSSSSSTSTGSSALQDGTYSATGDYTSPGGASSVAVTVALRSGTITSVTVKPKAQNPTARQYESQFASGISGVAVGKPIEGLQVGAVSGSSLTSRGFEAALAKIRAEAAS